MVLEDLAKLDPSAPPSEDPNVEASTEEKQEELPEEQIDWKVRAEAAEAGLQKLERDLKSEKGRRDLKMEEMASDIGGVNARLNAMGKRMASGETESLPGDFTALDQKEAVGVAEREWDTNYDEALEDLTAALMDGSDLIVSTAVRDDLSEDWKAAVQSRNVNALYKVVSRANREAKTAIQLKAQTTVTETQEAAKAAKKVSDTRHGINDMAISSPSGNGTSDNLTNSERMAKGMKEHQDGSKKSAMFSES